MKFLSIQTQTPALECLDGRRWKLLEPIFWTSDISECRYDGLVGYEIIPAGFITDLASIPAGVPIPPGPHHIAAILHDYLYHYNGCTRLEADRVLRDCCRYLGVSRVRTALIYAGVRIGGWWVWNRYRRNHKRL